MPILQKVKPQNQSYALDGYFVPGHWFFCRRVEIPADLEKGEEAGFALLELEALSPFPLEHLYYGIRFDATRRFAFLFAAYKRRFEGGDTGSWRRLDAVLPDFFLGLHEKASEGRPLILVTETSQVALKFDSKSTLPETFYAEPREFDEDGSDKESLKAFRARVSERFGSGVPRICNVDTAAKWVGSEAWFRASGEDGSEFAKVSFSRSALWQSDLRDPEVIEQAKRDERQNAVLWKGVLGIAALAALLFVGEIVWGGSVGFLAWRKAKIVEQQSLVQAIDQLQSTTNALSRFQESNLAPIRMIDALLPFQEWPTVIYRKFETNGPNVLVIDARSDTRAQVTEFKKRLERSNLVESVELSNQVNNPAGSTFTTTIRFVPGAFHSAMEVAGNE